MQRTFILKPVLRMTMFFALLLSVNTVGAQSLGDFLSWAVRNEPDAETKEIIAYPNPARHTVTVAADNGDLEAHTLEIYDVTGRWLDSYYIMGTGGEFKLDMSEFPAGKYLLRVIGDREYDVHTVWVSLY